jgi:ABC-type dipeptide/oligopeptide/nickel transport system ATPase component
MRPISEILEELNNHPEFIVGSVHTFNSVCNDMVSMYNGELTDEEHIKQLIKAVINHYKDPIAAIILTNDDDYYYEYLQRLVDKLYQNELQYINNGI